MGVVSERGEVLLLLSIRVARAQDVIPNRAGVSEVVVLQVLQYLHRQVQVGTSAVNQSIRACQLRAHIDVIHVQSRDGDVPVEINTRWYPRDLLPHVIVDLAVEQLGPIPSQVDLQSEQRRVDLLVLVGILKDIVVLVPIRHPHYARYLRVRVLKVLQPYSLPSSGSVHTPGTCPFSWLCLCSLSKPHRSLRIAINYSHLHTKSIFNPIISILLIDSPESCPRT